MAALSPLSFITQFEILRSSDYVLLTVCAPTGEVVDGKMGVVEVQKLSFTIPRFIELYQVMQKVAQGIEADRKAIQARSLGSGAAEDRSIGASPDGSQDLLPGSDRVIRH